MRNLCNGDCSALSCLEIPRSIRRDNNISCAWHNEFKIQPQFVRHIHHHPDIYISAIDSVLCCCRAIRTISISVAQQKFLYWRHAGDTACAIISYRM
mmetsp:Transcript_4856/g.7348  ORF Transcript_4856/g.7348 Transcript_4856/m.7348 type:complete len:97 (+) Transcript_4856:161-451(+)